MIMGLIYSEAEIEDCQEFSVVMCPRFHHQTLLSRAM